MRIFVCEATALSTAASFLAARSGGADHAVRHALEILVAHTGPRDLRQQFPGRALDLAAEQVADVFQRADQSRILLGRQPHRPREALGEVDVQAAVLDVAWM